MPFACLGVRLPLSALSLPPARKSRCGHPVVPSLINCPQCGISTDESPSGSIPAFDGTRLSGYEVAKSGDFAFVGLITTGYPLSIENFADIYIKMKTKLTEIGVWNDSFGIWLVS